MRRILAISGALLVVALLIVIPGATGAGSGGDYKIRGIFDNGAFIVEDEEVRVAGATVGVVESVDVTGEDEIASLEGGPHPVSGKAVVVMKIEDDGFKDFREDASCIIRPQSLIGEKFIDCTPTQPRAPGSEPPPELEEIPEGEPGEGQRLLPLENNGKSVDIDLIQNIQRAPYRDRFRIILNDLGAGLAARGEDLGEVIDRANPALRETNRVLQILALQNRQLASLASDGDAVLEPLARNRTSLTGFFRNAAIAGEATAERGADLEEGLRKFPATLRQVRLTMEKLTDFTDQGTPLFTDLNISAKGLSKATVYLPGFANRGIPALKTLGDAAEAAGPKLVASNGLLGDLTATASSSVPIGQNFGAFLDTFEKTKGFEYLMDFIYNSVGSTNGFDAYGHFLRSNLQLTACVEVTVSRQSGCEAFFQRETTTTASKAKKKGKKKKKKKRARAAFSAPTPPPAPQEAPTLVPAIPQIPPLEELVPPEPTPPAKPDSSEDASPKQELLEGQGARRISMRHANAFLRYLLGSGA